MEFYFEHKLSADLESWTNKAKQLLQFYPGSSIDLATAVVLQDLRSFSGASLASDVTKWLEASTNADSNFFLDGEFALAALVPKQRKIFLSRDWSGTGNIFYTIEDERIIVSTNVYKVVSSRRIRKFSESACAEYLAYEFVSDPNTLFENVFAVPRGSTITIDASGRISSSGSATLTPHEVAYEDIFSGLRTAIAQAHQKRIGSINGIYLSGGIDSSVMAICLSRDLGLKDIHAFSFGTTGAIHDETWDAKNVAQQLNLKYERVEVNPASVVDFTSVIDKANFPYPGMLFLGATAARIEQLGLKGINIFAGQDTRLHTPPYNIVDRAVLHSLLNYPTARNFCSFAASAFSKVISSGRSKRGFDRLSTASNLPKYVQSNFFHCHKNSTVTNSLGGVEATTRLLNAIKSTVNFGPSSRTTFNDIVSLAWNRQYVSDMAYMIGTTRAYGNRCSMPFYDRDLANYSAGLPMSSALKTSAGRAGHSASRKRVNKYILRKAYKKELTDDMIFRDKAVCVTNHMYLNGCMKDYISHHFSNPTLRESALGDRLGLASIYKMGLENNGKWQSSDYEKVIETHNLLFLEIIATKYGIEC